MLIAVMLCTVYQRATMLCTVPTSPNCDSAPWVGSSGHVGARRRRETLLLSQCAIAPRGMYGRPEQVGARSREKGYVAPRHVVTGTVHAHFRAQSGSRSPVAV